MNITVVNKLIQNSNTDNNIGILDAGKKAFAKYEIIWGYAGKALLSFRHGLVSFYRWTRQVKQMEPRIDKLRLFAIVGVPSSIKATPGVFKKIISNYSLKDTQGGALATLGSIVHISDMIDSTVTFTNAAIRLAGKTAPLFLKAFDKITLGVLIPGTISRGITIYKIRGFLKELDSGDLSNKATIDKIKAFGHKYFSISREEEKNISLEKERTDLLMRKKADLIRQSDEKIVEALYKIHQELDRKEDFSSDEIRTVRSKLNNIRVALHCKYEKVEIPGILTNIMNLTAFTAAVVFAPTAFSPFLLSLSFAVKTRIHIYQNNTLANKLNNL